MVKFIKGLSIIGLVLILYAMTFSYFSVMSQLKECIQ